MRMSALSRAYLAVILAVLAVSLVDGAAWAAPSGVDVIVIVDIQDVGSWLGLHQEALAAATDSARPLIVGLPARTGGRRLIALDRPKFLASLAVGGGTASVKVTITGAVNWADAPGLLTPFEQAAFEVQAGTVPNDLSLFYGLSGVVGRLLELHISRP
jgi:hypothetical protein